VRHSDPARQFVSIAEVRKRTVEPGGNLDSPSACLQLPSELQEEGTASGLVRRDDALQLRRTLASPSLVAGHRPSEAKRLARLSVEAGRPRPGPVE